MTPPRHRSKKDVLNENVQIAYEYIKEHSPCKTYELYPLMKWYDKNGFSHSDMSWVMRTLHGRNLITPHRTKGGRVTEWALAEASE